MEVVMERLLGCDCFVENLRKVFCRFRKASYGVCMDCRADIARTDVWNDRVQVRAGRRNISITMNSVNEVIERKRVA
jgi:hypothetical protein